MTGTKENELWEKSSCVGRMLLEETITLAGRPDIVIYGESGYYPRGGFAPKGQQREEKDTMIFYQEKDILVRSMEPADAQIICDEEIAQGWDQTVDKYEMRLADAEKGLCISLVAQYQGQIAGYINVYKEGQSGAFAGKGWPEIVDFGVLEKFRRKGIGSVLMDVAERIAGDYADTVWLGVGLYSGYGSAQRMYVKRGYIPDGSGVWYGDQVAKPFENYCNDDDLVLFMSKKL